MQGMGPSEEGNAHDGKAHGKSRCEFTERSARNGFRPSRIQDASQNAEHTHRDVPPSDSTGEGDA